MQYLMKYNAAHPSSRLTRTLLCFVCCSFSPHLINSESWAAAPITPSGLNTQVNLSSTPPPGKVQYDITGGTRPGGGTNLFHSFGDFGVPPDNIANFLNDSNLPTSNILARVTGRNASSIQGMIQTTGFGAANLFLMNPAGFLFGPNATVSVGGMMAFTTADYLRLSDNIRFNNISNAAADVLLSAAPVVAFGFIGSNPNAITFEGGQLTVTGGTGVRFVGGDINLHPHPELGTASTISAPGRQIQLTSVAGPGEVAADTGTPAAGMALGTITLDQGTILSTSGDLSVGDGSGGSVSIRGGQLIATGASILTGPAEGGAGSGGAIAINVAGSVTFSDSFIQTAPIPFSFTGSAGAVSITANDSISITNTFVDTSSQQAGGNGGDVTLRANGSLSLTDSFIGTGAYDTFAPGNGGAVTIMGQDVTFNNSGIFTDVSATNPEVVNTLALAEVSPGSVTVTGKNSVTFSGSLFGDPGIAVINTSAFGTLLDGGPVTITGKTVTLSNGSIVATVGHSEVLFIPSSGNGGPIEIRGNNVNLSEFTLQSDNAGFPESPGRGGTILLRGVDGLQANSIELTASRVSVASVTGGGGGSIELETNSLTMSQGSIFQTVSLRAPGGGGAIAIKGAETVTIQSDSQILTDTAGDVAGLQGAAGDILVETQNLTLLSGGQIGARNLKLSTGNAGNITVHGLNGASDSILIDGSGSGIFSTTEGTGKGGNINLSANSVTLRNGGKDAQVSSTSTGSGIAGDVQITAGNQFSMMNSMVTTEATQSGGGLIKITTNPDGTVQLTDSTISASVLNGAGGGGSVNIDPQYVILQNSHITANAVEGPGGNIFITTNLLLPDANSTITASSQFGQQGTVTIQSPASPASGRINPLGQKPLIATSLVNQRCAALAGGNYSSFTMAGRDSLPTEPGSWLSSPLALAMSPNGDASPSSYEVGTEDIPMLSLRQIAPPGFLTQGFAVIEAEGCRS